MLIEEINGVPATTHEASRLFLEAGFASTAMGIQARTDRFRPYGLDADGTGIDTQTAKGLSNDVDPDSADAEVSRDDMLDE